MLMRTHFENRETWLDGRGNNIGGSDAAATINENPWCSTYQLWQKKTGRVKPKDISNNERVAFGVAVEPVLRQLFKVQHPEYEIEYYPFDLLYQEERPWLFATLDGELNHPENGKGILEIKTSLCTKRNEWEAWNGKVPNHYFIQVLHQMLATGWGYAWLYAMILNRDGDATIRSYYFERQGNEASMEYLLTNEIKFREYVEKDIMPPLGLGGI